MVIGLPNEKEIAQWILETATHSYQVEYFLQKLQVGTDDPDRPHDIVNKYNKFDWEAIKGFSLQHRRDGRTVYHQQIMDSLNYHRNQYHHKKWNQFYPNASQGDMELGAVDAICSLLEPRGYQGGAHTYEQIKVIARENPIHKIGWMNYAISEMQKIRQPYLAEITSFSKIPTEGINPETHDIIITRVHETLHQLELDHGYNFFKNSESYIREVLK